MGMLKEAAAATAPSETPPQNVAPEAQGAAPPAAPVAPKPQKGAPAPKPGAKVAQGNPRAGAPPQGEEQATPEEQAAYEQAFAALGQVMYGEKTSRSTVDMLQPDDKVGSAAKASMLLIKMLDEKLDMDEAIVAQITEDTVTQVIDMAERVKQMVYSEQEAQQVLGATWEGVIEMFGTPPEDVKAFADAASPEEKAMSEQMVSEALGDPAAPVNG
jgi:hypothetical protein